nr:hypothetical protein [Tanacetum cinerariifolium]
MALTFADTYNMISYLTKSDASEGFDQIIDFLNASSIKYALTVNPNIYVSCIKQFWSSVSVKKVNDVIRLQALVDRKKVIITEATVRETLRLDDAESIDCLANEEIFTELSRMSLVRNVDSSSKFYMYPRFLKLMIRTQVGDLSSHTTKYSSPALTQKVFANIRRVGKGFSGIETPLFEGMVVAQQADDVADEGAAGIDVDVVPAVAAEPSIPSPTPTTQPPPPSQELPSTLQVIPTPPPSPLAQPSSPPQQPQPSQPIHDAKNSMDFLHTLLETCTTLTRKVEALEKDKVAQALEIIKIESSADTVMDDQEDASKHGGIKKLIDAYKDVSLENVKSEKDADVQGRQAESQAQIYQINLEHADKVLSMNMAGFKMDYFKGMSYDDIRPIFDKYFNSNVAFLVKNKEQMEEEDIRALKRKTESSKEKAAKKQKLDKEVEKLKKHLQIVPNDDDDVYTEATPLALKLFLSFLSLLRNFEREDLEMLWQLVKERFESSKPKNFSDDFLLTTLTYMFEKPNVDAQVLSSMGELTFFWGLQVKQKQDGIFISQAKYIAKILRKFGITDGKLASTPIDTEKPLFKDLDGEDVDIHTYRYLKGKPHLGLWYPKDLPFNLVAYLDSDYAGASLDRKSTIGGSQFLCCRLISWQCKKQTDVATLSTEAEYVAAASCCAQVLWIQNQFWIMDKFQLSSMGELTFFWGLQVKQKQDGIFISQAKYIAKILRKFGITDGKLASTPIDTEKPLFKDLDGEDVDIHTYRSMIGSLMYLTSSRPDIM